MSICSKEGQAGIAISKLTKPSLYNSMKVMAGNAYQKYIKMADCLGSCKGVHVWWACMY